MLDEISDRAAVIRETLRVAVIRKYNVNFFASRLGHCLTVLSLDSNNMDQLATHVVCFARRGCGLACCALS